MNVIETNFVGYVGEEGNDFDSYSSDTFNEANNASVSYHNTTSKKNEA
jgi:hypothetical protein